MALDYEVIVNEFIRVAEEGVGTDLSTINVGGVQTPSVIKSRDPATTPSYPYIVVDILSTVKTNGWLLDEGIDELDQPYFETNYKLLLQYTVYGGNANSIAHKLESFFRIGRVLDTIYTNTTGKLEQTFDVNSLPESLATDNLEVAAFNLTFNITDRVTDIQQGVFDTINLDGELAKNVDDPSPLPLDVFVTSVP